MTNAELHVSAFLAAYGECPVPFPTLQVIVESVTADGDLLKIDLYDELAGCQRSWRYPDPEVWVPDENGDVPRYISYEDDNKNVVELTIMGRIDPVAVATPEFRRQVEMWRQ